MNKKGDYMNIMVGVVIVIIIICFSILIYIPYSEIKLQEKLDECVAKNYDGLEYDYNKIISCCRELDYRDSYCLKEFKPGYKEDSP